MRRFALLMLALAAAALLHADLDTLWTATIDGGGQNSFHDVCLDFTGVAYAVGFTTANGGPDTDGLITRIDESGQATWTVSPGGEGWDYLEDVCQRPGGGCVAVGRNNASGSNDGWVYAVDGDGDMLWSHTYGGDSDDHLESIIKLGAGYLLCGGTQSFGLGEEDIWLIRLDEAGDTLWSRTHGSAEFDRGHDVLLLTNGGFLVIGATNAHTNTRNAEILLLKLDVNGDETARTVVNVAGNGPVDYDAGFGGCLMPDGSLRIVGVTAAEGVELMDIALLRVDQGLNVLAQERYELRGFYDFGYDVIPSVRDGACIVSGTTRSFNDCLDHGFLMCVNEEMDVVWSEVIDEPMHCGRYKLDFATNGDILQCGWARTGDNTSTAIVQRLRDSFLNADIEASPSTGHAPLQGMLRSRCISSPPIEWIEWDLDNDGVYETSADSVAFDYDQPGCHTIRMRACNSVDTVEVVRYDLIRVFDGNSCVEFTPYSTVATCEPTSILHQRQEITVEAWIRPDGWGESSLLGGRVADKGSWGLYVCQSNPALADSSLGVFLRTEGATMSFGTTDDGSMPLGEWLHVAFTYSAANGAHAYINGVERALTWSAPPSGTLLDHENTLLRVGDSENGQAGFDGLIDELRVWDYTRTQQQIQEAMGNILTPNDVQLVAFWRMDEGSGDICDDNSAWSHTLHLTRAGWRQGTPFESTPVDEGATPALAASRITSIAPNPFNPETTIRFEIDKPGRATLTVYNIRGQRVATLFDDECEAGRRSVVWRADDAASGVYFARLRTTGGVCVRKLAILK